MSLLGSNGYDPELEIARDRIVELNTLLIEARHHYYVISDPTLKDAEYDALEKELKDLVAQRPALAWLAPVLASVGSDLTGDGGRVKHIDPMLSLDNMYTLDELRAWMTPIVEQYPDVFFSVEPKVDGVSDSLHYLDHKLVKAVTRGDGLAGEDCTQVVATSGAVQLELNPELFPKGLVEIRGEIWISTMRMEALNKEQEALGKKPWTSPRNLASGTLKLKDLSEVKRRGLSFMPWDVRGIPQEYLEKRSRDQKWSSHGLDYIHRCGHFAQPLLRCFEGKTLLAGLEKHIADMRLEREVMWHGPGLGMLTDGLVIKVENPVTRAALGEESRCPNWAVSYKFQDSRGETTLLDVQWSVSRNGKLTPVGILEPIVLNGATISRVNLNNPSFMEELGLSIGCKVELLRSGDVIPVITKVIQ